MRNGRRTEGRMRGRLADEVRRRNEATENKESYRIVKYDDEEYDDDEEKREDKKGKPWTTLRRGGGTKQQKQQEIKVMKL